MTKVKTESIMDAESSTSSPMPPDEVVKKVRKPAPKRKRKSNLDEDFDETAAEAKKLQQKFASRKRNKDEDAAILKVKNWDTKPKVINCDAHNNIVNRAEENQISKMYQIEYRPDVLATQWKCALCGKRTATDDLGDLFGPYYIKSNGHCPSFLILAKKGAKLNQCDDKFMDMWFHGDCILWAPDIHLRGNQLWNLDQKLPMFWKQKCVVCHHEGAAIPIGAAKHIHFPCAKKNGYKMDEAMFSCHL